MFNLPTMTKQAQHGILHLVLLSLMSFASFSSQAFSLDDVIKRAEKLAKNDYASPVKNIPPELASLQFADYQKIQFKKEKSYWGDRKSRFKLQFYHQGMYFDSAVKINEIVNNVSQEIKYSPDYFDLSAIKSKNISTNKLGFAGFKVQYPINNKNKTDDEIFTALGASYFRVIGKGQIYGLSARGLAIDTGEMSGEEFPHFSEFWLERPAAEQRHLIIYALLDSPSVTGAYKFTIVPSIDTTVAVEGKLFFRNSVKKLGLAPLTSMYLFSPNQPSSLLNYRLALHDSDGLSILSKDNEWIWRPLNNPKKLSFSAYQLDEPKGFGLIQRNKKFDDYLDLDDHYEKRPSTWVELLGSWHKGHVELVEIPTADETNDNIVAFWVPEQQYTKGDNLAFKYRLHFTLSEQKRYPKDVALAKNTRLSLGDIKQANLIRKLDGTNAYVIDFSGANLSPNVAVSVISSINNGKIISSDVQYNEVDKGWRVFVRFSVNDIKKATDIRIQLAEQVSNKIVTETWSGQYPAQ